MGEKMGEVGGGGTTVRIYCTRKKYFNKRKTLEIIKKEWGTEKERRRRVPLLKTTFISSPVLAPDSFTNPHIYLSFLFDNPATEPLKQTLSMVLGLSLKATGEKSHEGGAYLLISGLFLLLNVE